MTWFEYPKWVGGKIVGSVEEEAAVLGVKVKDVVRSTPPDLAGAAKAAETFIEYPKWVHGKIVNSMEEELAALETAAAKAEARVEAELRANDAH